MAEVLSLLTDHCSAHASHLFQKSELVKSVVVQFDEKCKGSNGCSVSVQRDAEVEERCEDSMGLDDLV